MTEQSRRIPQPTSLEDSSVEPEVPEEMRSPPPSPLRAVQTAVTGQPEFAVLYKRTYRFEHDRPCRLADEQLPLAEELVEYGEDVGDGEQDAEGDGSGESGSGADGPVDDGPVSYRKLPDLIGYKPGTDVVVHGSARPPEPVSRMTVSVEVGDHPPHRAEVFGRRVCRYVNGSPVFTDPEPFEEMPLRYENAYGGQDPHFEAAVADGVMDRVSPEDLRRTKAVAEELVSSGHPLMYPRNRFGKGYVIDEVPEAIEGRELPNLELPSDRLTPDRLVVGNPLDWNKQPLPIGFGYLDASSFPRCSMFGLPPPTIEEPGPFVEVERGLIPSDFSRGNIFTTPQEEMGGLIHPWAGRVASLGLALPLLRGDEEVRLTGVDPVRSPLRFPLPGEMPRLRIPVSRSRAWEPRPDLYLVDVDVPERVLSLVWAGRVRLDDPITPERQRELESVVEIEMVRS